jgi:hypothetical protein
MSKQANPNAILIQMMLAILTAAERILPCPISFHFTFSARFW